MNNIGIYKITNKITNKVYIGQSIDIKLRWAVHKQPSNYFDPTNDNYYRKIYTAFREYGIENFEFSIIENCSKEQLNEREIYWINYYNSFYDGYNMTLGGEGGNIPSDKKIYQYDRFGNFIQEFMNVREAATQLNLTTNTIYSAICDHCLGGGYQWSYQKADHIDLYENNECPVIAYDLLGKKIKMYNSINLAAKNTGDGWRAITTACKTLQYNNTQFQWRYAKDFYNIETIQSSYYYNPIAVNQYSLDGVFIKSYNNFNEIKDELKLNDISQLSNLSTCLKKQQKSFKGYLWTYYNEPAPIPYIDQRYNHTTSSNKRSIQQYSKDNIFIQEYNSAHEAARQIGKPKCANHITECCQNKRKTCEGFIWKYKEE